MTPDGLTSDDADRSLIEGGFDMYRFIAPLLAVVSVASAQPTLEYRIEPLADLYMHVRWLAQQDAQDVPPRFRPAVDAARAIGQAFGRNALGWGVLDGNLPQCTTGEELAARFEQTPDPVRIFGGREVSVRTNAMKLSEEIERLEPWWVQTRWDERRRAISHAQFELDRTLTPIESTCLQYMIDSLDVDVPERAVPVYLVGDGPWPGAMTFYDNEGAAFCISTISVAEDTAFHETILHEATHALDVNQTKDQGVFERLRRDLVEAGIDRSSRIIRDVPHAIMFIHAGATIRKHLNPEHVDYGDRDGLYDRLSYAHDLIPLWHQYLAGEFSLDETIDRIVNLVVKAKRRVDPDH